MITAKNETTISNIRTVNITLNVNGKDIDIQVETFRSDMDWQGETTWKFTDDHLAYPITDEERDEIDEFISNNF